jgi:hypothetical protein
MRKAVLQEAALEFDWSPISPAEWRLLLNAAPRANLLQSWPYAVAARLHDQMMSRRGRIVEAGRTLGILQIQEVRVGPVHVLRLHRGPLWLDADPPFPRWQAFFRLLACEFPRRIGRWRHILPELDASEETRALIEAAGFRPRNQEPYRTILLDLTPPLDTIRRRLKGKWRNSLCQAERSGIAIAADIVGATTSGFLARYGLDKSARGYRGPKPARLATLIAAAAPAGEMLILNAQQGDTTVAAVLIFRHGQVATYQAGWTTEYGRQTRAHHLLLWRAIETLKTAGAATLDLGGIHPRMAEGVTRFKEGLGGEPMTLIGLYG